MSDKEGKWHAYNLNNGPHDCKKPKQENHSNGNNGNDISLELLLKKLESIGITLDLNKLRNCEINNNASK